MVDNKIEDNQYNKKIVDKIYFLAKQKNIKINELESKMEVTVGYLKKLAKGKSSMGIEKVKKAADILGVTIDFLVSEEQERKIIDENKLLVEYLQQIRRFTDADEMSWNYETWDESVDRVLGLNERTRLDDEKLNLPFFAVDRYDPEDRDTEYCKYIESNHGSYKADVEGTYYAKIPNMNLFLAVIETFYENTTDSYIPDVLLTDCKSKYDIIAIGFDYLLGEDEQNECVYPELEALYMSIKRQWDNNNGWLSHQVREELNRQLQMFKQIKVVDGE